MAATGLLTKSFIVDEVELSSQRIAVLLPDLRPGGAERLHVNLAAEWERRGIRTDFILLRARGELLDVLPQGTDVVELGVDHFRSVPIPLARYLRKSRPDALLAAMWPLTVFAPIAARLARFPKRIVVSEHSPLTRAYANRGRLHGALLRCSQGIGYPLADARVGVSSGVADDLANSSGLPRHQFAVIHNPAAREKADQAGPTPTALMHISRPLILTVGTLKKVKRHDLLINAFARLPAQLGATLCILGEGPERLALESQINAFGLSERVLLPGFAIDTAAWYASADLFVLSSDYEGFGNVLVEAMEHGLPIVSTDCPSGPREILDDNRYGTLVPVGDPGALAQAMQDALSREHDGAALKVRAAHFSVSKAADAYLNLLLPDWRQSQTSEAVGS
ncbi:glycosyltransferase [Lysobacter sp. F6437]|uniref:glycosyltransferase n=1 Tax=Lysobacter sp. F6437 TaxID=3459296 RepID=UPI00403DCA4F